MKLVFLVIVLFCTDFFLSAGGSQEESYSSEYDSILRFVPGGYLESNPGLFSAGIFLYDYHFALETYKTHSVFLKDQLYIYSLGQFLSEITLGNLFTPENFVHEFEGPILLDSIWRTEGTVVERILAFTTLPILVYEGSFKVSEIEKAFEEFGYYESQAFLYESEFDSSSILLNSQALIYTADPDYVQFLLDTLSTKDSMETEIDTTLSQLASLNEGHIFTRIFDYESLDIDLGVGPDFDREKVIPEEILDVLEEKYNLDNMPTPQRLWQRMSFSTFFDGEKFILQLHYIYSDNADRDHDFPEIEEALGSVVSFANIGTFTGFELLDISSHELRITANLHLRNTNLIVDSIRSRDYSVLAALMGL